MFSKLFDFRFNKNMLKDYCVFTKIQIKQGNQIEFDFIRYLESLMWILV